MGISGRRLSVAAGVLAALVGAAPALAQHGGGGHGGGGGGGHSGGGHFGGGGGAHFAGGGHGGPVGHSSGGHYGGGSAGGHLAGHYAAGTSHYAGGYGASYHAGGYGAPGGGIHHGYSTGAYWNGGYWRGGYWPRAYYGLGYSWFLPVLPLAYATYWYSGVPYYYANDVYYTWNPAYDGYTASDPPPVTESAPADGGAMPPQDSGPGPDTAMAAPGGPAPGGPAPGTQGQIFMYPKNGQSDAQQSTDKRECQQWAAGQAGTGAANSNDYRRAMVACVEGRGYSAN